MNCQGFEYTVGNLKIGKDTLIYNMGSATNCSSRLLGLCHIEKCYALKAEGFRPAVLPYRTRQEEYWLNHDAIEIAEHLLNIFASKRRKVPLRFVRINEAGDFHSGKCLTKLIQIAKILPHVRFYTYTHRSDLITSQTHKRLPRNLVIQTSNFKRKGMNQFKAIPEVKVRTMAQIPGKKKEILKHADLACMGDCSICSLCKVKHGKVIGVPLH